MRWVGWLWIAFLFSIPVWMTNLYFLHVLIITGIFIIASMSLNVLLGYTGQLNLGQAGFFGLGAYSSALFSLGFELKITETIIFKVDPHSAWLGFIAGTIVAAFLAG